MEKQKEKQQEPENGSIALTKPKMAVLTPNMPAISTFGLLSHEFSAGIMERAKTAVGGYGMYALDFLSEDSGERSTVFSPVFNFDMSVLLGKMEQLKTETNRETREHTQRVVERTIELRMEREKAKPLTVSEQKKPEKQEKPIVSGEKKQAQQKSAKTYKNEEKIAKNDKKQLAPAKEKQPSKDKGAAAQGASFYQITQNFYSGLLPSRDAAAGKTSQRKSAAYSEETEKKTVRPRGMLIRENMTVRPPEMLFSRVLDSLQKLELTYATETEEIPAGPVPRDRFLKQTAEKYQKESYIPDFVLAEIKSSYSRAPEVFGAGGTEQGLEYIVPGEPETETAKSRQPLQETGKTAEQKALQPRRPLQEAGKGTEQEAFAHETGVSGLELKYAPAAESHSYDAPEAPRVPTLESAESTPLAALKALEKQELFRAAFPEAAAKGALAYITQDGEIPEAEKAFLRQESSGGAEKIIYSTSENAPEAQSIAQAQTDAGSGELEYKPREDAGGTESIRKIGVLRHFQSEPPRRKAGASANEELRVEYAMPSELEDVAAPLKDVEAELVTAAASMEQTEHSPVLKAGRQEPIKTKPQTAAETPEPETFLRQGAEESEYIKSLPDWTRDFLKNGYEPVQTVLNAPAPEQADAAQTAAESGETGNKPAAAPRQSIPAQEEQMVWTNPTLAPPPKETRPPQELSLKQPESSDAQQQAYISDAEIKRAADKVYKMIEDRLRREKRRLGL